MKTQEQIRRAEIILSQAASVEKDPETYEVVSNLAMALKWVLEMSGGEHVAEVINIAAGQLGGHRGN